MRYTTHERKRDSTMNNPQVINSWIDGKNAKAQNLKSIDGKLFSYALQIGNTLDGTLYLNDATATGGDFYSNTTSTQVNKVKRSLATSGKTYFIRSKLDRERSEYWGTFIQNGLDLDGNQYA